MTTGKILSVRVRLEQPFLPPCPIGFRQLKFHSSESQRNQPLLSETPSLNLSFDDLDEDSPTNEIDINLFEEKRKPIHIPPLSKISSPRVSPSVSPSKSPKWLASTRAIISSHSSDAEQCRKLATELGVTCETKLNSNINTSELVLVIGEYCSDDIIEAAKKKQILIVKKDWIEDCHKQQRRLPITAYFYKQKDTTKIIRSTLFDSDSDSDSDKETMSAPLPKPTLVKPSPSTKKETLDSSASPSSHQRAPRLDLETYLTLPTFFNNMHFGIADNIDLHEKAFIERYIVAYGGVVEQDWEENLLVSHLISKEPNWNQSFRNKIENHPSATGVIVVQPDWVFDCHNSQSLQPENEYLWIED